MELKLYTTLGYIFNDKMFHQEASAETIKMMHGMKPNVLLFSKNTLKHNIPFHEFLILFLAT